MRIIVDRAKLLWRLLAGIFVVVLIELFVLDSWTDVFNLIPVIWCFGAVFVLIGYYIGKLCKQTPKDRLYNVLGGCVLMLGVNVLFNSFPLFGEWLNNNLDSLSFWGGFLSLSLVIVIPTVIAVVAIYTYMLFFIQISKFNEN